LLVAVCRLSSQGAFIGLEPLQQISRESLAMSLPPVDNQDEDDEAKDGNFLLKWLLVVHVLALAMLVRAACFACSMFRSCRNRFRRWLRARREAPGPPLPEAARKGRALAAIMNKP